MNFDPSALTSAVTSIIAGRAGMLAANPDPVAHLNMVRKRFLVEEVPGYVLDAEAAPVLRQCGILTPRVAVTSVIGACEERSKLNGLPYDVRWRTNTWNSQGRAVLGRCGATSTRDRETWVGEDEAPLYRLELSLGYWLLVDDTARYRLIHHELGHVLVTGEAADPDDDDSEDTRNTRTVGHDVQEHVDTVARFGPQDAEQWRMALAAIEHPATAALSATWGVSNSGQALLPWGE